MKHFTTPEFWDCFNRLPESVQKLARKNYQLLKDDSSHSLRFKKIGIYYSVRVGRHYRALGIEANADVVWFWIGTHADYDQLLE